MSFLHSTNVEVFSRGSSHCAPEQPRFEPRLVFLTTDNSPSHLTSPQCMLGKGLALVMTLSGVSSLEVR